MSTPIRTALPYYLPTIYESTRPDNDPMHPDHWAVAWTWRHGFRPHRGLRNDQGNHLADALEFAVAERTAARRDRGRVSLEGHPPTTRPGFVFLDGSGVVVFADRWLPVSPDGTIQDGRCDWLRED